MNCFHLVRLVFFNKIATHLLFLLDLGSSHVSSCFQALDLKPNYVRTWENMGISYVNQAIS